MMALDIPRIVNRLNKLISKRFGVNVQYFPVTDRRENVSAQLETVKRNSGAPMIVAHNQILIPVRVEGSLIGAAQVDPINFLKPQELSQVMDTIDLVLGEAIAAHSLLDLTTQKLDHIVRSEGFDNILPFRGLGNRALISESS